MGKMENQANPPAPEGIDSEAALHSAQGDDPETAMKNDFTAAPALPQESIKDRLTAQELRFLEIFFNAPRIKGQDRMTIDKAMILSGYGDFSERMRYLIARKTFQKYAKAAPGAAKIFQKLGFGPVRVAMGIIDHAENAPPTVSLNALKLAAQCQGMIDQPDNPNVGITINLNVGPSPGPAAPGSPAPVVGVFGAPDEAQAQAQPRRPLQITR